MSETGARTLFEIDIEAVDDLTDSLRRRGSAQDYPRPGKQPPQAADHTPRFRAAYTDLRSRTSDADLAGPAVPGYRDLAPGVVVDFRVGYACVPAPLRRR